MTLKSWIQSRYVVLVTCTQRRDAGKTHSKNPFDLYQQIEWGDNGNLDYYGSSRESGFKNRFCIIIDTTKETVTLYATYILYMHFFEQGKFGFQIFELVLKNSL